MCVGASGMFVCVRHIGLSVVLCVRERQRKREMKEISFYLFLLTSSLKNKSRLQKTHRSTRITSVKVLSAKKGIKERKEARRFVSSHKSSLCFPSLQKLKVRECERHVGKDRFLCFTVFSSSCQADVRLLKDSTSVQRTSMEIETKPIPVVFDDEDARKILY